MLKRIFFLLIAGIFFVSTITIVFADDGIEPGLECQIGQICRKNSAGTAHTCQPAINTATGKPIINTETNRPLFKCQPASAVEKTFGKIDAPDPLKGFFEKDPTGAGAISQFLSNGIALFFSIAAIVLLFMILWGAFQWMTSGGDKEQLASAQKRIINAIIGIILFAIAFAIIAIFGQFTGFRFFIGQNAKFIRDANGNVYLIQCVNGSQIGAGNDIKDPDEECRRRGQR